MTRRLFLATGLVALRLLLPLRGTADERADEERLCFQTHAPWTPRTNLNADVAIVYGIDPTLPERMDSWRRRGYRIHVMTGVAWGEYQDYLEGRYDGARHWDEAQTERDGTRIMHGSSTDVPYMSPTERYGQFLTAGVKRALDAGAEAIHLEEPEFWARAGYEPSFQREWQAYYGDPWQPPHSSHDAQYRASKLKYVLYQRALRQVLDFVRAYGHAHQRRIRSYVPTHSLINYAHWRIVSPESSLLALGVDGYIAQVWTGTARTPNVYEGRRQERTFETAFLEYGAMQNLVRASGRRIWYLNDPIEDHPDRSWSDYRRNWESTLVASLLHPDVWHYEIMPWPDRVFAGSYPAVEPSEGKAATAVERVRIPKAYETELQAVIHALGEMKQPADRVRWDASGTERVGVLVSDTMMFQRADPEPSDEHLGSFYGLAMPLLKRGLPVEPVQIENVTQPGFLSRYALLLLTYEGQKPSSPEIHDALTRWVWDGAALVVIDDDRDPYNAVREWWNVPPYAYTTPRHHLFRALGLRSHATGLHRAGRGAIVRASLSPASLTYMADGGGRVRGLARQAAAAVKLAWKESNALVLRRGPYLVGAGLSESVPGAEPLTLKGRYIDLFDATLPVIESVTLAPNKRALLFDLDAVTGDTPQVVAAACRVRNEQATPNSIRFVADGIADTEGVVRILAPHSPSSVTIGGKPAQRDSVDFSHGTARLRFPNSVDGVVVEARCVARRAARQHIDYSFVAARR
ncbi:MAG: hypothetical protein GEV06_25845 [Luteitalea sp.]|nr:hypothetical protein [Luteitalea sp.]